jgi:hypothetical protein
LLLDEVLAGLNPTEIEVRFPQGGEAFPVFGGNARNEAAVRMVVELNCGLKSI